MDNEEMGGVLTLTKAEAYALMGLLGRMVNSDETPLSGMYRDMITVHSKPGDLRTLHAIFSDPDYIAGERVKVADPEFAAGSTDLLGELIDNLN